MSAREFQYRRHPQYFTVAKIGDYICGRLVTLKQNSPRLLADTTSLETILDQLPEGYSEVSYNYFAFHSATLYGLYAYYNGSVSLRDFGDRLQGHARRTMRPLRSNALAAARRKASVPRGKDIPKAVSNQIDLAHAVSFSSLMRRETMDKVIAEWREVQSVTYQLATTQADASQYEAIGPYTRGSVHELKLVASVPTRTYGAKIAEFVGGLRKKFGTALMRTTLTGTNHAGDPRTIDLGKITDSFASHDMAAIHSEAQRRVVNLAESQVIQLLIAEANDRPDYFVKVLP